MGSVRSKEIVGDALARELFRRGIEPSEASIEIGAAPGYIKDAIRRNRINNYAISSIKRLYNINPETYMDIQTPEKTTEPHTDGIDYNRLYDVIVTAVREALGYVER